MKVRLCKVCGYQLHRKSRKCRWCKTPVKKITALHYSISALMVFPVFIFLVPQFSKDDFYDILPSQESIQSVAVKKVEAQPPIKIPEEEENVTKVYVKGTVVNLRKLPTVDSPALGKLKRGQQLTKIARSGNWVQVLADDIGGKRGWIHASLVGKSKSIPPSKPVTQHQPYSVFPKYFKLFNAEIKLLKGTTFFENVEYLDHGVIQVTATDIFLSAPELYKKKYVRKITQKWFALRDGFPAVVRIVNAEGILRMKKKRG